MPTSTTGRLVGALVMVIGIGFLTVITASITSDFVEAARRRLEGGRTDDLSAKLDQINARLDTIETGLTDIRGRSAMLGSEDPAGRAPMVAAKRRERGAVSWQWSTVAGSAGR